MWLFTRYGFYSVVAHKDDEALVVIRARVKEDLEHLKGVAESIGLLRVCGTEITETAESDYRFRLVVKATYWQSMAQQLIAQIDYTNFKGEIHSQGDPARDAAYMSIWSIMRNFQEQKARPVSKVTAPQKVLRRSPDGDL